MSKLTEDFRKLAGLQSLTERSGWRLPTLSEADSKVQQVVTKLRGHAEQMQVIARELSQKTGTPLEFYSVASDLLGGFAEMLKTTGDKDLGKPLRAVAGKLAEIGNANRHTNNWNAVPVGEALDVDWNSGFKLGGVQKLVPNIERSTVQAVSGITNNLNELKRNMEALNKVLPREARAARRAVEGSLDRIAQMVSDVKDINVLGDVDKELHKQTR